MKMHQQQQERIMINAMGLPDANGAAGEPSSAARGAAVGDG